MTGINAYKLLDGIDDDLIEEAEDVYAGVDALTDTAQKEKRERKPMPAVAAAACVAAFALGIYLTLLALGSGKFDRVLAHFGHKETGTVETETDREPTDTETDTESDTEAATEAETDAKSPITLPDETVLCHTDYTTLLSGPYLFECGGSSGVLRYDPATGEITSACVRPGCRHIASRTDALDDCPLAGAVYLMFSRGTKLYYIRQNTCLSAGGTLCMEFASYDYKTDEYRQILAASMSYADTEGYMSLFWPYFITSAITDGDSAYITCTAGLPEGHPTQDKRIIMLRIDLNTDTIAEEVLVNGTLTQADKPLFVRNGEIIIRNTLNGTLMILDLTTHDLNVTKENKEEYLRVYLNNSGQYLIGDWLWMMRHENIIGIGGNIIRVNITTGEEQVMWDGYADWFRTDGKHVWVRVSNIPDRLISVPEKQKSLMYPTEIDRNISTLLRFDMDMNEYEVVGWTDMDNPALTAVGLLESAQLLDLDTGVTKHIQTGAVMIDARNDYVYRNYDRPVLDEEYIQKLIDEYRRENEDETE